VQRWGMMNKQKMKGRVREEDVRMACERARKGEEKMVRARGGAHQSSSSLHRPSFVIVPAANNVVVVVIVVVR
jgi:hypothetical protein